MAQKKAARETAGRLERFFDALARQGVDGAVLDRRNDCFYFTGYTGSDAVLLLSVRKRRGWLITDSRYTEEARDTAPGVETVIWRKGFGAFAGGLIRKQRMRNVAYTPVSLSVAFFNAMRDAAGKNVEWTDAANDIAALRSVKSAAEIAAMSRALACAEAAFTTSRRRWKIGMSETEVKNDLEWEMRKRGAQDTAFETIVAVGPNAALPHAHAGSRKIQGGKMLLIDFGACLDRYNSDLTRTIWAGEVPKVWLTRYRRVLEAQQNGIAAIKAGVPCRLPDTAARKPLAAGRIEDNFTHGLGHGVGLAIHEDPRLNRITTRALEAGNVVTVEPGVYFPGSGGIRVEDMVLVEAGGARVLSSLPRDVDSIVF